MDVDGCKVWANCMPSDERREMKRQTLSHSHTHTLGERERKRKKSGNNNNNVEQVQRNNRQIDSIISQKKNMNKWKYHIEEMWRKEILNIFSW